MKKYILAFLCTVVLLLYCIKLVGTQVGLYDNSSNPMDNESPLNMSMKEYYRQVLLDVQEPVQDKIKIQLFYESMCNDCRVFFTKKFVQVELKLGLHLDILTYPYGNARTIVHKDNKYEFRCQHGPAECYGNKLHACAIYVLGKVTWAYVPYNSCMMEKNQAGKGSDDDAADVCGMRYDIDSNAIKQCAKGSRGAQLLKYYGEESKKVGFSQVPYILINGAFNDGSNLMTDICNAFIKKPQECYDVFMKAK